MGFIFASTTSSVDQWYQELENLKSFKDIENNDKEQFKKNMQRFIKSQALSHPMENLRPYFDFKGPQSLICSSCSASLQALALAALWIETGLVSRCVVASTEVISPLTTLGFDSLRLLSRKNCRPFDKNRSGINLGEAAAVICLEASTEISKNRKNHGQISGFGLATDAHHATAPHPIGQGSAEAIMMALARAELTPENIDWIYAHGTASISNDLSEMKAIQSVFANSPLPPIVSTKSIHGHTLAASGLLESVIGLVALNKNHILKNHFCETWDPAFFDNPENRKDLKNSNQVQHFLKNSLGFGGINATVVLSRA